MTVGTTAVISKRELAWLDEEWRETPWRLFYTNFNGSAERPQNWFVVIRRSLGWRAVREYRISLQLIVTMLHLPQTPSDDKKTILNAFQPSITKGASENDFINLLLYLQHPGFRRLIGCTSSCTTWTPAMIAKHSSQAYRRDNWFYHRK
jgi:hypothetical protein